jgi:Arc/MetJ family transcription regulator
MRMNIDIDADLLAEVMRIGGFSTKSAAVEYALREVIRLHQEQEERKHRRLMAPNA